MAKGSAEVTPGSDKGGSLAAPMPNGQTRMKPPVKKNPPQPVKH